ncbi:InlB B-repeat-containing protein [Methanorbis rubei]|uniref:InlB B-repeat-containing protein n=1 Tax=Methanorbis rubei TaxID=3028300 RepID=UPI0030B8EBBE
MATYFGGDIIGYVEDGYLPLNPGKNIPGVTWTGDTSGYTLTISQAGNYKLTQGFNLNKMTVTASDVVVDGDYKTITLTKDAVDRSNADAILVEGTAVLQNITLDKLSVVVNSGTTRDVGSRFSAVGFKSVKNGTISNSVINLANLNQGSPSGQLNNIYFEQGNDLHAINNTLTTGKSNYNSIGVDTFFSDSSPHSLTVEGNTINLGNSGATGLGSMGVRLYGAYDTGSTQGSINPSHIVNNTIFSTDTTNTPRKIGIGIYKVNATQKYGDEQAIAIIGNTIDLTRGTSTSNNDSLLYIGSNVNATFNLTIYDNTFTANTGRSSIIYVDNKSSSKPLDIVTLSGSIYNNKFSNTNLGFGNASGASYTNNLKWDTDPTTSFGPHKKIAPDQKYLAGNWWVGWSENYNDPNGYLSLTEKAAGLPVADLYPLVKVGAAPTKTIIVTGNFSVAATGANGVLNATFSDGSSGQFSWSTTDSDIITLPSPASGASIIYTPKGIGTANLTVSADGVQKTVLITVYNITEPELPINEPVKEPNGNTSITSSNSNPINVDPTDTHKAIIEDKSSGTTMIVIFNEPQTPGTTVQGNVTAVGVVYPPDVAVIPPEGTKVPKKASYQLNLSLGNVTSVLPIISPDYDADVSLLILSQGYTAATMITASAPANHNLDEINSNITTGGILVNFTVPKEWVDTIGRNNIKAFHVKNGKIDMLDIVYMSPDPTDPVTITVKGNEFSAIVLAAYTGANPGPNPGPQPVSSSSDGNMENSFRVLFDAKGGSFVQPATGLSYGDRVPEPVTPTKDGYVFGGWYKDEAMNILWIFKEDALPGDMTLYAKWISGNTGAVTQQQSAAITQPTASATQQQTSSATAVASAATSSSAGVSPTMTQAPAPIAGLLFGALAAGLFLRRRE